MESVVGSVGTGIEYVVEGKDYYGWNEMFSSESLAEAKEYARKEKNATLFEDVRIIQVIEF